MGGERGDGEPDEPERVEPGGDSAGVYEISIAEFEGRLPRSDPPGPPDEG